MSNLEQGIHSVLASCHKAPASTKIQRAALNTALFLVYLEELSHASKAAEAWALLKQAPTCPAEPLGAGDSPNAALGCRAAGRPRSRRSACPASALGVSEIMRFAGAGARAMDTSAPASCPVQPCACA